MLILFILLVFFVISIRELRKLNRGEYPNEDCNKDEE